jgi:hypothetical protein
MDVDCVMIVVWFMKIVVYGKVKKQEGKGCQEKEEEVEEGMERASLETASLMASLMSSERDSGEGGADKKSTSSKTSLADPSSSRMTVTLWFLLFPSKVLGGEGTGRDEDEDGADDDEDDEDGEDGSTKEVSEDFLQLTVGGLSDRLGPERRPEGRVSEVGLRVLARKPEFDLDNVRDFGEEDSSMMIVFFLKIRVDSLRGILSSKGTTSSSSKVSSSEE